MDEELQELEKYLVQLSEQGQTERARVVANEIARRRFNANVEPVHALVPGVDMREFVGESQPAAPDSVPPGAIRLGLEYDPEPEASSTEAGGKWEPKLPPREQGRAAFAESPTALKYLQAGVQGAGTAALGAGTPLTAFSEFIASRITPGRESLSPGDALEYARGIREGAAKEVPGVYWGMALGGGVAGSMRAASGALGTPIQKFAQMVTPRARGAGEQASLLGNVARTSLGGATAGGVTGYLEEGVPGAAIGTSVGAVLPSVIMGAVGGGRIANSWLRGTRAGNILAQQIKEGGADLATRYRDYIARHGYTPAVVDLVGDESLTNVAARVSMESPEAAQRFSGGLRDFMRTVSPRMEEFISRGGRSTTIPEKLSAEAATITIARQGGFGGTAPSITAMESARNKAMDAIMGTIRPHQVMVHPLEPLLNDPAISRNLDPLLRREIATRIQGTGWMPIRMWEEIRQALKGNVDRLIEGGQPAVALRYRAIIDEITDQVSSAVPEYGTALADFAAASRVINASRTGEKLFAGSARDFADHIRYFDPATLPDEVHGMAIGLRREVSDALSGTEANARKFLDSLNENPNLMQNLSEVLNPNELAELENLAGMLGRQQERTRATQLGRTILDPPSAATDAPTFEQEAAGIAPFARGDLETGARGRMVGQVMGDSNKAAGVAAWASPGSGGTDAIRKMTTAFGGDEANRIADAAGDITRGVEARAFLSGRNIAALRARENASEITDMITGAQLAGDQASVAVKSGIFSRLIRNMRLTDSQAREIADIMMDPERAHEAIEFLTSVQMSDQTIMEIYRDAAIAAGIIAGAGTEQGGQGAINQAVGGAAILGAGAVRGGWNALPWNKPKEVIIRDQ